MGSSRKRQIDQHGAYSGMLQVVQGIAWDVSGPSRRFSRSEVSSFFLFPFYPLQNLRGERRLTTSICSLAGDV
jgi:hypothetical protein